MVRFFATLFLLIYYFCIFAKYKWINYENYDITT